MRLMTLIAILTSCNYFLSPPPTNYFPVKVIKGVKVPVTSKSTTTLNRFYPVGILYTIPIFGLANLILNIKPFTEFEKRSMNKLYTSLYSKNENARILSPEYKLRHFKEFWNVSNLTFTLFITTSVFERFSICMKVLWDSVWAECFLNK